MLISDLNENYIKKVHHKKVIPNKSFVNCFVTWTLFAVKTVFGIIFLNSFFKFSSGSQIINYPQFCSDRPKNQFSGFLQAINQYFLEITLLVSIVTALHNTVEERGLDE
jgi:hypothetical protein